MINDKENMTDFRKISPQRRSNPSTQSNYRKYKLELREDFHQRCGYCGDHDFFRQTYYEIDHFVPSSIDENGINIYYIFRQRKLRFLHRYFEHFHRGKTNFRLQKLV